MVSLCQLANKSLQVMAAIHAHVRDQVVLHVHRTHVDAITKGEHYALASKFLQEMVAICALARDQEVSPAHHSHVDQLDVITKVEP